MGRRGLRFTILFLIGTFFFDPLPALASATGATDQEQWLEPKGLNIVDMVGQVPEAHLANASIVFSGEGLVQYVSGRREGDRLVINVRIFTKPLNGVSYVNCLGQWAFRDQWSSITPAATMRIFERGIDITDQVLFTQYFPAGKRLPENGAYMDRYSRTESEPIAMTGDGALILKANMGCTLPILGDHPELTAEFVINHPQRVRIEPIGVETFQFHSYIGVGDAGRVNSLREQMMSRFGFRHDKFALNPPAAADYAFVKYPPTPVSAYPTGPVNGPSSGTYRLAHGLSTLSVDHVVSMGLPIDGQCRDSDQAGSVTFLPHLQDVNTLTGPEYFVPTGVQYDSCMTNGGCPSALLDRIYNSEMPLTIYYYRVTRIVENLERLPLRQVGTRWSSAAAPASPDHSIEPLSSAASAHTVFMPYTFGVEQGEAALPPDSSPPENTDGCPCGWFDANGAMLDFIPGP